VGRITYLRQANDDLLEIWVWIARDSVDMAEAVLDRILARIEILRRFPEAGPVRDEIGDGSRSLVTERWLVLYRLTQDGVQIVRIVDSARDLTRLRPAKD
jgi:toxin ParE1/3/4